MSSQVFINSRGILEVNIDGIDNYKKMVEIATTCLSLAIKRDGETKKLLVLVDCSKVTIWNRGVFLLANIMFKNIGLEKIALFGANPKIAKLQKAAFIKTSYRSRTQFFGTRKEAEF